MVGARCHIGAGAVLAGVIEPASALPVVVEDEVLIGANAVVLEGCRIGRGAVVAAGAVVISDVPPESVVAGCPAHIIKHKSDVSAAKTALVDALRERLSRRRTTFKKQQGRFTNMQTLNPHDSGQARPTPHP